MTEAEMARANAEVPELMGATEVAQELGVKQTNMRKIPGLPEPCTVLIRGALWRADVIREFAAEREVRRADRRAHRSNR
jgi:hypothetical protein